MRSSVVRAAVTVTLSYQTRSGSGVDGGHGRWIRAGLGRCAGLGLLAGGCSAAAGSCARESTGRGQPQDQAGGRRAAHEDRSLRSQSFASHPSRLPLAFVLTARSAPGRGIRCRSSSRRRSSSRSAPSPSPTPGSARGYRDRCDRRAPSAASTCDGAGLRRAGCAAPGSRPIAATSLRRGSARAPADTRVRSAFRGHAPASSSRSPNSTNVYSKSGAMRCPGIQISAAPLSRVCVTSGSNATVRSIRSRLRRLASRRRREVAQLEVLQREADSIEQHADVESRDAGSDRPTAAGPASTRGRRGGPLRSGPFSRPPRSRRSHRPPR